MYQYHIFDLDGTLMDSMPYWTRKMLHILEEDGIDYPADIIEKITPLGDLGTAEYFLKLGVKCNSAEEVIARMDTFAGYHYSHTIQTKPYVPDYLRALKEKNCRLAVLTASPHRMTDICLKRNGIYELFDEIWTTEDFPYTKADVRIYEAVGKLLDCALPEAVFYDDNLIALKTAKQAGLVTVGVYDSFSEKQKDTIRQLSDRYIVSFQELLEEKPV